ncbi:MAG: ATP-binding cassette domain-containing protein, partial [Calditrichaeota bacterium]
MMNQPSTSTPLLRAVNLHKRFPLDSRLLGKPRQFIHAVNGVSLELHPGRTVGLVGESGSGKSTVGK